MSPRTLARAGRLHLPPHRASSATLAGAYPFLTVPLPAHGVPIGDDALTGAAFAFDLVCLRRPAAHQPQRRAHRRHRPGQVGAGEVPRHPLHSGRTARLRPRRP